MATHSRSPRPVPPSVPPGGEAVFHARGGESMFWKLIVALLVGVGAYWVPPLSKYWFAILLLGVIVAFVVEGVRIVPQQFAYVVERLGKFHEVLEPGLNLIIPFLD